MHQLYGFPRSRDERNPGTNYPTTGKCSPTQSTTRRSERTRERCSYQSNGRRTISGFSQSLIKSALIKCRQTSNVYISSRKSMTLRFFIHSKSKRAEAIALIDSGATENFMNLGYAKYLQLPIKHLEEPRSLFNVDGTTNKSGSLPPNLTKYLSSTVSTPGYSVRKHHTNSLRHAFGTTPLSSNLELPRPYQENSYHCHNRNSLNYVNSSKNI